MTTVPVTWAAGVAVVGIAAIVGVVGRSPPICPNSRTVSVSVDSFRSSSVMVMCAVCGSVKLAGVKRSSPAAGA